MNKVVKESTLSFTDENGKEIKGSILFEIDMKDKNYLIYTDNTTDENGDLRTFASRLKKGEKIELLSLEDENEWNIIEKFLSSIVEKNIKE